LRERLCEDAEFDTYQMLEAGVPQYRQWCDSTAGRHILVAVARYIVADSRTERAQLRTATVARRLSLVARPCMRTRETATPKAPSDTHQMVILRLASRGP